MPKNGEVIINGVELSAAQLVTMIVGTLLVVCLVLLKVCYNSFSLPYVLRTYGERKKIEDEYNSTYMRREDLLFHMDWAKARGDNHDAKRLEGELEKLEKELDTLDDQLSTYHYGQKAM